MRLKDRFILTGLVPPTQVPELTNAMDILVHPSRREGLARALPQGSLAQCPVIAYDIDGNREGVRDTLTGYVLPPFDTNRLSQSLEVLLADRDLRQRMGIAGREFALRDLIRRSWWTRWREFIGKQCRGQIRRNRFSHAD